MFTQSRKSAYAPRVYGLLALLYTRISHVSFQVIEHTMSTYQVVNYDPKWPSYFLEEANILKEKLNAYLLEIYHIGSTAIPGLSAKPNIDMILVFDNLDMAQEINHNLIQLDYLSLSKNIIPHRSFITSKKLHAIGYHLHLYERGDPQINRHVYFKDFLIAHPAEKQQYEALKFELKKKHEHIQDYVQGKSKLVQTIDSKAKIWATSQNYLFLSSNKGSSPSTWPTAKINNCIDANLNVHMTHFAQYINKVTLTRIPDYTLVNSHLNDDTFNYVLRADFEPLLSAEKIDQVSHYFDKAHLPFSWWIGPNDSPANLSHMLEKYGYQNSENNIAMYLDLEKLPKNFNPPAELKIKQVKDKTGLQDFALVLSNDLKAFSTYFDWLSDILTEEDPIEFYVGYVNNKPVVRGLTCYYAQVAGFHWLSTCVNERNKGYGTAMQQFRLNRAKTLGYHIAVLQASHEGYPLYKKLGYQRCETYQEFKKTEN